MLLIATVVATAWAEDRFIPANDAARFMHSGQWEWKRHRYAAGDALSTSEDGAALEFTVTGSTLVLCLDALTPPNNYGPPELGRLEVLVDGRLVRSIYPRAEDREIVLLRRSNTTGQRLRIVHRRDDGVGCRIRGVREIFGPSGDLALIVTGEENDALNDIRAVVSREGRIVREELIRNWLTGQCGLTGLAPADDYVVELRATGWKTRRLEPIAIHDGTETVLPPVHLQREFAAPRDSFKFPILGRAAVVRPGGSFNARFEAYRAQILGARLARRVGPAFVSRRCAFDEDKPAGYYYDREGRVTLPADTPPGLYDLEMTVREDGGERVAVSARSVQVLAHFPAHPIFVVFGHLDTWGQYQAEYLERLVSVANIIAPDMVLDSNEANPAYAFGALAHLQMPVAVTFGNHRHPEPAPWVNVPVGVIDFGEELAVMNYTPPWEAGVADADRLWALRPTTRVKVVNAFEPNAPVDWLERHGIRLLHYAHGPGRVVGEVGATPTFRVGKLNSASFRIIRFKDRRPVAYGYRGDPEAPIPFPRDAPPPVRVGFAPANDGSHDEVTATLVNDLDDPIPAARAVFILPAGNYDVKGGAQESTMRSDDGRFTVLVARCDLPAVGRVTIAVARKADSAANVP